MTGILLASSGYNALPAPVIAENFSNTQKILAYDGSTNDYFGQKLLVTDTNLYVGAPGDDSKGSVYAYEKNVTGNYSTYFDGNGDYLTFPNTTLTSDFTIELWFYQASASTQYIPLVCSDTGTYNFPIIIDYGGTGYVGGYFPGGSIRGNSGAKVFEKNIWNHIAVSRSGSNIRYFVNGVLVLTLTGITSTTVNKIGGYSASSYLLNGYISNLRVVIGASLFNGNFEVSISPLTPVPGTALLTCQSESFKDFSSNNFTINFFGNTSNSNSITPFEPSKSVTIYTITQKLTASDGVVGDQFGSSLAISSNYLVIGAPQNNSGAAYVFEKSGNNWVQSTKLVPTGGIVGAKFGTSLAIENDTVFAGAESDNSFNGSNTGSVYVFQREVLPEYSVQFDGTGDYLSLPSGSMNFMHQGATSWTFECWFYTTSSSSQTLFSTTGSTAQTGFNIAINNPAGKIFLQINRSSSGNSYFIVTTNSVSLINSWNHLAITFDQTTKQVKIYLNGVNSAVTTTGTATFSSSAATYSPNIGRFMTASVGAGGYFVGYISNVRVISGVIQYTSVFIPPTTSLTAVNGTVLLTGQSLTLKDNSSNNFTVTANGNAVVSTTNPFNTSVPYVWNQTQKLSGDDSVTGSKFGAAMAIEKGTLVVGSPGHNSDLGSVYVFRNNTQLQKITPSDIVANDRFGNEVTFKNNLLGVGALLHDGNKGAMYAYKFEANAFTQSQKVVAGDAAADDQFSSSIASSDQYAVVGAHLDDGSSTNSGSAYIYNFDIVENYSVYFDGTGDYLTVPANALFTLGSTSNFTIDCWIFPNGSPTALSTIVSTYTDLNPVSGYFNKWHLGFSSPTTLTWYDDTGNYGISKTDFPVNQWSHVAVVRNGSTITMYFNGISIGTQTTLQAYTSQSPVQIGYVKNAAYFNGYISNLRIVKGTAVYTGNFTSPTRQLSAITGTSLLICQSPTFIDNSGNGATLTSLGNASISQTGPFIGGSNNITELQKITAPDPAMDDNFGVSVGINSNVVAVGSPKDDDKGTDSGSVYVFVK